MEVLGKIAGEWTGRVEISKEEILGSKRSMYDCILTYSRLYWAGGSWRSRRAHVGFPFPVRQNTLSDGVVKLCLATVQKSG